MPFLTKTSVLYLFVFLSVFIPVQIFGQQKIVKFRHLNNRDGLQQSAVTSIVQDKSGYVWVGTWGGLFRYDGTEFKNFRPNDSIKTAVSHKRVNKIYEDKQQRLWVGTGGGLNLYNPQKENFLHVGISNAKGGSNFITAIQQDSYGQIWVATYKGIKRVNKQITELLSINQWERTESEMYGGSVLTLFEDNERTIWAGIRQGIKRFDPKTAKILPLPAALQKCDELSRAKIIVIKQTADGDLWFGSEENGLFKYDVHTQTVKHYTSNSGNTSSLPSNWLNDILVKDNEVWVATRSGLAILNLKTDHFTVYNHDSANYATLSDDSIWSLYNDNTNNVWIGTHSGGINISYPGNANFINIGERVGNNMGLNKPLAESIVEDENGGLWIGTFGGGLNYINRQKNIARYYNVTDPQNNRIANDVKALAKDSLGNLWLGTLDGLCRFNRQTAQLKFIDLNVFNGKTAGKLINALLADKDGIWVGTNGAGLRRLNYAGIEVQKFFYVSGQQQGLSDNYVNCLLRDGNSLWIGTQNGLNVLNTQTGSFKSFNRKTSGLGNNNVLALAKHTDGRLWIGTDGGGLNYLDQRTGKIYAIKQANGLVDNTIVSILEDNTGALWVGTNNGLSQVRVTGKSYPLAANGYQIQNYTTANGLQSNQFIVNARLKTRSGELMFGGMNGVQIFTPERIVKNKYAPRILLTGFTVNNKPLSFGRDSVLTKPVNQTYRITLPHNKSNFAIRFSALNFINPDRNTYAYKMTGITVNDDWHIIGNTKEVAFANLAPGNYTLTIKAANNDGVWNTKGRSLHITINPPFWLTWWAITLYFIIAVYLLYKVIRFFQIRARLERDLYNEHLQMERQEEFYKMKLDFFTNISHEIRTPLTLILGPLENLLNATLDNATVNRQITQVKNNADRLLRLVSELMDFRKAETGNMVLYIQRGNIVPFLKEIYLSFATLAESKQIDYTFICDAEEILLFTDRDQLEKVFFNLLSNAFKFTPQNGKITMEISQADADHLTIKITDNGKGIPLEHQQKLFTNFYQVQPEKANPGTGVGLALSKSIIELHNGSIWVKSTPQQAGREGHTEFTVKIPYHNTESDKVHLIEENLSAEHISKFKLQTEIDVVNKPLIHQTDKKYTVLLVEDNAELRNFIEESLSQHYKVIACDNGQAGYEKAITEIPDLVISDVMMPVMNGLELCRKLKADERTSHIPVVLLTALAANIHQINGFQTGAEAYLTKPFSIKLLELNVHNLLLARETMRRKFSQQITLQPLDIPVNNTDERFITKLMTIIYEKMEDPEFGVTELGNEIGMSKTVLYKKIVALTDLSPADFIKSIRLKKAAELLKENSLTVNEVSTLIGFNDRKYFSREFKKMHGKTPSEMMGQGED